MGGGSSKTAHDLVNKEMAVKPFKIVIRNCKDLAKTDSNGLTDCYVVGRFWDQRADKYLKKPTFKSSVRKETLNPEFNEVSACSLLVTRSGYITTTAVVATPIFCTGGRIPEECI